MKLIQFAVCFVFLLSVIIAAPRNFDDSLNPTTSSYVMIGNSKESYKKLANSEEKFLRSSYSQSYPSSTHHKPSSDYYQPSFGGPSYNPQSPSLISANVNLLEPFMLVTFLMFVLSRMDKARLPPPYFSHHFGRTDLPVNFTDHNGYCQHQQHFLEKV
jgi:hypothetical protein